MSKVVLLLWAGVWGSGAHGGPAAVQGFESIRECEAAREGVIDAYKAALRVDVRGVCHDLGTPGPHVPGAPPR